MAASVTEMIESRKYLLEFQKEQLLNDLEEVPSDKEHMEKIIDAVFYKLFGKGWDKLSSEEQGIICEVWRGAW